MISAEKIIQVSNSIPWVRCASGNVFVIVIVKLNKNTKEYDNLKIEE